jgi:hypothetical protein
MFTANWKHKPISCFLLPLEDRCITFIQYLSLFTFVQNMLLICVTTRHNTIRHQQQVYQNGSWSPSATSLSEWLLYAIPLIVYIRTDVSPNFIRTYIVYLFSLAVQPSAGYGLLVDEWSARRKDLYLTTQNTHNIQTSMPPVGFENMIAAGERPQTYALDRAATGTGIRPYTRVNNKCTYRINRKI